MQAQRRSVFGWDSGAIVLNGYGGEEIGGNFDSDLRGLQRC